MLTDCETTGLFPKRQRGQPQIRADDPSAPYVATIAWQLRDADSWRIAGCGNFYLRPDGWTMPQGPNTAGEVTGLTDEILHAIGLPAIPVAATISSILSMGVTLVAHGTAFDSKMIRGFLRRNGFPDYYGKTKTFCTQMTNIGVCKLKQAGSNRPKTPKLAEAFAHWFPGEQQPAAHSAWNDVLTLARLYKRMKDAGMDMTPREHVAQEEDGELDGLQQALAEPVSRPTVNRTAAAPAPQAPVADLDTPTLF
jgi:hypothetical protein